MAACLDEIQACAAGCEATGYTDDVYLVVETWPGDPGLGTKTTVKTKIEPRPKVERMQSDVRTGHMAHYQGRLKITKVSLSYTLEQLEFRDDPTPVTAYYEVSGRRYVLDSEPFIESFSWTLELARTDKVAD